MWVRGVSGLALLLLGVFSCSSSSGAPTAGIDGTWDIVFTGGPYQTGTLSIAGSSAILTLEGGRCSGTENVSGNFNTAGDTFNGQDSCGQTFVVNRTSTASSSFGQLGGHWAYGDKSGSPCTLDVSQGSFAGTCTSGIGVDGILLGKIQGTLSSDGNTVVGVTTPPSGSQQTQFAASRR